MRGSHAAVGITVDDRVGAEHRCDLRSVDLFDIGEILKASIGGVRLALLWRGVRVGRGVEAIDIGSGVEVVVERVEVPSPLVCI